jgi:hypothetical protein
MSLAENGRARTPLAPAQGYIPIECGHLLPGTDPIGSIARRLPLFEGAAGYELCVERRDGALKLVLDPR